MWRIVDSQGNLVEGHVAVVSAVSGNVVQFYQANAPHPTGSVSIANGSIEDVKYTSGGVHYTMQVEGLLRYDGS